MDLDEGSPMKYGGGRIDTMNSPYDDDRTAVETINFGNHGISPFGKKHSV